MAEYLVSHIMLNVSPHHMSIIGDKNKRLPSCTRINTSIPTPIFKNHGLRFSRWHFTYGIHNITNHQWNDKCHCCPKECKKKICKKTVPYMVYNSLQASLICQAVFSLVSYVFPPLLLLYFCKTSAKIFIQSLL